MLAFINHFRQLLSSSCYFDTEINHITDTDHIPSPNCFVFPIHCSGHKYMNNFKCVFKQTNKKTTLLMDNAHI